MANLFEIFESPKVNNDTKSKNDDCAQMSYCNSKTVYICDSAEQQMKADAAVQFQNKDGAKSCGTSPMRNESKCKTSKDDVALSPSFTIPKLKRQQVGLFTKLLLDSHEFLQEIKPAITKSYMFSTSHRKFTFLNAQSVHNPQLMHAYLEKRRELKQDGYTERELSDSFAFLFVESDEEIRKICQEGIKIGNLSSSAVGQSSMGVQLCRYGDVLRSTPLPISMRGQFIMFKIMKGRVKTLSENCSSCPLEPTPNHDCHVFKATTLDSSTPLQMSHLFECSQIYLYEYGDLSVEERPRHIYPNAVVTFTYRDDLKHSKSVDATIPNIRLGSTNWSLSPRISPCKESREEEYVVWSGELCVKGLCTCQVKMVSMADRIKPAKLGCILNITKKCSLVAARNKYFSHVSTLPKNAEVFSSDNFINVTELRPAAHEDRQHFQKVMTYLGKQDSMAVLKPNEDTVILMMPDCSLSYSLGLTKPHQYPIVLHCIFISKTSCRLMIPRSNLIKTQFQSGASYEKPNVTRNKFSNPFLSPLRITVTNNVNTSQSFLPHSPFPPSPSKSKTLLMDWPFPSPPPRSAINQNFPGQSPGGSEVKQENMSISPALTSPYVYPSYPTWKYLNSPPPPLPFPPSTPPPPYPPTSPPPPPPPLPPPPPPPPPPPLPSHTSTTTTPSHSLAATTAGPCASSPFVTSPVYPFSSQFLLSQFALSPVHCHSSLVRSSPTQITSLTQTLGVPGPPNPFPASPARNYSFQRQRSHSSDAFQSMMPNTGYCSHQNQKPVIHRSLSAFDGVDMHDPPRPTRFSEVPVAFGGEFDMKELANSQLSGTNVKDLFTAQFVLQAEIKRLKSNISMSEASVEQDATISSTSTDNTDVSLNSTSDQSSKQKILTTNESQFEVDLVEIEVDPVVHDCADNSDQEVPDLKKLKTIGVVCKDEVPDMKKLKTTRLVHKDEVPDLKKLKSIGLVCKDEVPDLKKLKSIGLVHKDEVPDLKKLKTIGVLCKDVVPDLKKLKTTGLVHKDEVPDLQKLKPIGLECNDEVHDLKKLVCKDENGLSSKRYAASADDMRSLLEKSLASDEEKMVTSGEECMAKVTEVSTNLSLDPSQLAATLSTAQDMKQFLNSSLLKETKQISAKKTLKVYTESKLMLPVASPRKNKIKHWLKANERKILPNTTYTVLPGFVTELDAKRIKKIPKKIHVELSSQNSPVADLKAFSSSHAASCSATIDVDDGHVSSHSDASGPPCEDKHSDHLSNSLCNTLEGNKSVLNHTTDDPSQSQPCSITKDISLSDCLVSSALSNDFTMVQSCPTTSVFIGNVEPTISSCKPTGISCEPTGTSCKPTGTSCEPTGTSCEPTGTLCEPTGTLCEPTGTSCEPTGTSCKPTGTSCEPTGTLCKPTETSCEPTGTSCEPTGTSCEPTGISCEPTGTSCKPTGTLCEPTGTSCKPTGTSCKPTGTLCEPTGTLCEPTGTSCEPTGTSCEPTGTLCEPTGTLCEPTGTSCKPTGTSCEPTGTSYEPTGTSCKPTGTLCEPTGTLCKPTETSYEPTGTSCKPTGTLCEPTETSCEPTGTSCEPTETSCEPTAISCEPTGTLCKPTGISCKLPETLCETTGISCKLPGILCETTGISCESSCVHNDDKNTESSHTLEITKSEANLCLEKYYPSVLPIILNNPAFLKDSDDSTVNAVDSLVKSEPIPYDDGLEQQSDILSRQITLSQPRSLSVVIQNTYSTQMGVSPTDVANEVRHILHGEGIEELPSSDKPFLDTIQYVLHYHSLLQKDLRHVQTSVENGEDSTSNDDTIMSHKKSKDDKLDNEKNEKCLDDDDKHSAEIRPVGSSNDDDKHSAEMRPAGSSNDDDKQSAEIRPAGSSNDDDKHSAEIRPAGSSNDDKHSAEIRPAGSSNDDDGPMKNYYGENLPQTVEVPGGQQISASLKDKVNSTYMLHTKHVGQQISASLKDKVNSTYNMLHTKHDTVSNLPANLPAVCETNNGAVESMSGSLGLLGESVNQADQQRTWKSELEIERSLRKSSAVQQVSEQAAGIDQDGKMLKGIESQQNDHLMERDHSVKDPVTIKTSLQDRSKSQRDRGQSKDVPNKLISVKQCHVLVKDIMKDNKSQGASPQEKKAIKDAVSQSKGGCLASVDDKLKFKKKKKKCLKLNSNNNGYRKSSDSDEDYESDPSSDSDRDVQKKKSSKLTHSKSSCDHGKVDDNRTKRTVTFSLLDAPSTSSTHKTNSSREDKDRHKRKEKSQKQNSSSKNEKTSSSSKKHKSKYSDIEKKLESISSIADNVTRGREKPSKSPNRYNLSHSLKKPTASSPKMSSTSSTKSKSSKVKLSKEKSQKDAKGNHERHKSGGKLGQSSTSQTSSTKSFKIPKISVSVTASSLFQKTVIQLKKSLPSVRSHSQGFHSELSDLTESRGSLERSTVESSRSSHRHRSPEAESSRRSKRAENCRQVINSRQDRQYHPYRKVKQKDKVSTFNLNMDLDLLMENLTKSTYRMLRLQTQHPHFRKDSADFNIRRFANYTFVRSPVVLFPENDTQYDFTPSDIPEFDDRSRRANELDILLERFRPTEPDCPMPYDFHNSIDDYENESPNKEHVSSRQTGRRDTSRERTVSRQTSGSETVSSRQATGRDDVTSRQRTRVGRISPIIWQPTSQSQQVDAIVCKEETRDIIALSPGNIEFSEDSFNYKFSLPTIIKVEKRNATRLEGSSQNSSRVRSFSQTDKRRIVSLRDDFNFDQMKSFSQRDDSVSKTVSFSQRDDSNKVRGFSQRDDSNRVRSFSQRDDSDSNNAKGLSQRGDSNSERVGLRNKKVSLKSSKSTSSLYIYPANKRTEDWFSDVVPIKSRSHNSIGSFFDDILPERETEYMHSFPQNDRQFGFDEHSKYPLTDSARQKSTEYWFEDVLKPRQECFQSELPESSLQRSAPPIEFSSGCRRFDPYGHPQQVSARESVRQHGRWTPENQAGSSRASVEDLTSSGLYETDSLRPHIDEYTTSGFVALKENSQTDDVRLPNDSNVYGYHQSVDGGARQQFNLEMTDDHHVNSMKINLGSSWIGDRFLGFEESYLNGFSEVSSPMSLTEDLPLQNVKSSDISCENKSQKRLIDPRLKKHASTYDLMQDKNRGWVDVSEPQLSSNRLPLCDVDYRKLSEHEQQREIYPVQLSAETYTDNSSDMDLEQVSQQVGDLQQIFDSRQHETMMTDMYKISTLHQDMDLRCDKNHENLDLGHDKNHQDLDLRHDKNHENLDLGHDKNHQDLDLRHDQNHYNLDLRHDKNHQHLDLRHDVNFETNVEENHRDSSETFKDEHVPRSTLIDERICEEKDNSVIDMEIDKQLTEAASMADELNKMLDCPINDSPNIDTNSNRSLSIKRKTISPESEHGTSRKRHHSSQFSSPTSKKNLEKLVVTSESFIEKDWKSKLDVSQCNSVQSLEERIERIQQAHIPGFGELNTHTTQTNTEGSLQQGQVLGNLNTQLTKLISKLSQSSDANLAPKTNNELKNQIIRKPTKHRPTGPHPDRFNKWEHILFPINFDPWTDIHYKAGTSVDGYVLEEVEDKPELDPRRNCSLINDFNNGNSREPGRNKPFDKKHDNAARHRKIISNVMPSVAEKMVCQPIPQKHSEKTVKKETRPHDGHKITMVDGKNRPESKDKKLSIKMKCEKKQEKFKTPKCKEVTGKAGSKTEQEKHRSKTEQEKPGSKTEQEKSGSKTEQEKSGSKPEQEKPGSKTEQEKSKMEQNKSESKTKEEKPISQTKDKPISKTKDKPISKTKDDKPRSKTKEDKPISKTKDDKPRSKTKEDKLISKTKEDKPISKTKENKPISKTKEDKLISKTKEVVCEKVCQKSKSEMILGKSKLETVSKVASQNPGVIREKVESKTKTEKCQADIKEEKPTYKLEQDKSKFQIDPKTAATETEQGKVRQRKSKSGIETGKSTHKVKSDLQAVAEKETKSKIKNVEVGSKSVHDKQRSETKRENVSGNVDPRKARSEMNIENVSSKGDPRKSKSEMNIENVGGKVDSRKARSEMKIETVSSKAHCHEARSKMVHIKPGVDKPVKPSPTENPVITLDQVVECLAADNPMMTRFNTCKRKTLSDVTQIDSANKYSFSNADTKDKSANPSIVATVNSSNVEVYTGVGSAPSESILASPFQVAQDLHKNSHQTDIVTSILRSTKENALRERQGIKTDRHKTEVSSPGFINQNAICSDDLALSNNTTREWQNVQVKLEDHTNIVDSNAALSSSLALLDENTICSAGPDLSGQAVSGWDHYKKRINHEMSHLHEETPQAWISETDARFECFKPLDTNNNANFETEQNNESCTGVTVPKSMFSECYKELDNLIKSRKLKILGNFPSVSDPMNGAIEDVYSELSSLCSDSDTNSPVKKQSTRKPAINKTVLSHRNSTPLLIPEKIYEKTKPSDNATDLDHALKQEMKDYYFIDKSFQFKHASKNNDTNGKENVKVEYFSGRTDHDLTAAYTENKDSSSCTKKQDPYEGQQFVKCVAVQEMEDSCEEHSFEKCSSAQAEHQYVGEVQEDRHYSPVGRSSAESLNSLEPQYQGVGTMHSTSYNPVQSPYRINPYTYINSGLVQPLPLNHFIPIRQLQSVPVPITSVAQPFPSISSVAPSCYLGSSEPFSRSFPLQSPNPVTILANTMHISGQRMLSPFQQPIAMSRNVPFSSGSVHHRNFSNITPQVPPNLPICQATEKTSLDGLRENHRSSTDDLDDELVNIYERRYRKPGYRISEKNSLTGHEGRLESQQGNQNLENVRFGNIETRICEDHSLNENSLSKLVNDGGGVVGLDETIILYGRAEFLQKLLCYLYNTKLKKNQTWIMPIHSNIVVVLAGMRDHAADGSVEQQESQKKLSLISTFKTLGIVDLIAHCHCSDNCDKYTSMAKCFARFRQEKNSMLPHTVVISDLPDRRIFQEILDGNQLVKFLNVATFIARYMSPF